MIMPDLTDRIDKDESEWIVIADTPLEIGGERAIANIDESFALPCSVFCRNGDLVVTLPNAKEAYRVARYAIRPDGGFGSVSVQASTDGRCTHQSFEDWL